MVRIRKSKFKIPTLILTMLSFTLLVIYFYLPKNSIAENPNAVVLKAGTPVNLRLTEEVSPKTKNVGDVIHFEVVGDVKVGNNVVVKAGAPAEGEVTILEKRAMLGRPDKIAFMVRSTQAVDGNRVPLRATLTREGQEKETSSLALGLFLCFLFLWQKGGTAEFPVGTEIRAYVDYDTNVDVSASITQ